VAEKVQVKRSGKMTVTEIRSFLAVLSELNGCRRLYCKAGTFAADPEFLCIS
jgi:hypothetical protein